jgi:hypothetical protein
MIDLNKRVEKLTISLEKKNVQNIKVQVGNIIDVSGSMQSSFASGLIQEVIERLFAIAIKFDDNGELENWIFSNGAQMIGPVTINNVEDFVKREIINSKSPVLWGGTSYAPALKKATKHYNGGINAVTKGLIGKVVNWFKSLFGKTQTVATSFDTDPAYLLFITDGVNDDMGDTTRVIESCIDQGIYIQFVGIGYSNFNYIERLGDKYKHVGFVKFDNLSSLSETQMYDELITEEFITFLKNNHPNSIS